MKKIYALLGTGAIGGYCATKLNQAGFDMHCLLRSDFEAVKKSGLTVMGEQEKINTKVHAYQNISDMPKCDVVFVALKTTENHLLKTLLPQIMHENSIVVLLQNGIGSEQELAEFLPAEKIIGAICSLKVSKIAAGVIRHFGANTVNFAQYYLDATQEGVNKTVEELAEIFNSAGIKSHALPHLNSMRWAKLCGNLAMSGLCTVLNASVQELVQNPTSFKLLCNIIKEGIEIAEKSGAKLGVNFYQERVEIFKAFVEMPKTYSSMKEDFDARRPLELHGIYENALTIAKQYNVAAPLIEALYQQLIFLNERNLAQA